MSGQEVNGLAFMAVVLGYAVFCFVAGWCIQWVGIRFGWFK
jgi:hypothetical protein